LQHASATIHRRQVGRIQGMCNHEQETVGPCGNYSFRGSRGRIFILWSWLHKHRSDLSGSYPGSHPRSDAFTQDEHGARRCQTSSTEDGVIARTPAGGTCVQAEHLKARIHDQHRAPSSSTRRRWDREQCRLGGPGNRGARRTPDYGPVIPFCGAAATMVQPRHRPLVSRIDHERRRVCAQRVAAGLAVHRIQLSPDFRQPVLAELVTRLPVTDYFLLSARSRADPFFS
jgi:hypothetical protein